MSSLLSGASEGLRGQLVEVTAVVRGELAHVPEAPAVGDARDLNALLRAQQIAAHTVQTYRLQILLGTDVELLAK